MFNKLTVQGGCSLLGGLALIMVPIPFIMIKFGPKLRANSKYSGESEGKDEEKKEKKEKEEA